MKKKESKEIKFTDANKSLKMNFFVRAKRAICNVERYGEFLLEKTSTAVKYFLILILIVTLVLTIVSTYQFSKIANKAINYVRNDLPDFTYENGKVMFANSAEGYDKEVDFYDIINTDSELSDGVKEEYKNKVKDYSSAIILLQDEVIVFENGKFIENSYEEIEEMYNLNIKNKTDLVQTIDSIGIAGINSTYFIAAFISLYISNLLTFISDILMVCVFGYLVGRLSGVPLTLEKTLVLSFYSLTLSIILSTIYIVVYSLTGFVIEYFSWMYLLVAYIYIIASILIIKSDLIKQQMELQKIYKVEAEVKKELQEQKDKEEPEEKNEEDKEDKKDKKKKEKDNDEPVINREPDGSEI